MQLFFIFTTNFLKLNYKKMEKKNLLGGALGIAISLGVLFGTVWVIGKAWHSSQKS